MWNMKYCRRVHLPTRLVLYFAVLAGCAAPALPQDAAIDGFQAGNYRDAKGNAIRYRLFIPQDLESSARYPLVLFLHGLEAFGSDNRKQISGMDYAGSHAWTNPLSQSLNPAFVLAPQCPRGKFWANPLTRNPTRELKRVVALLDYLMSEYPIDPDRIYVTGQSLGAYGTWALISSYPGKFAAAVTVCGGGRTGKARALANLPIWVFHGTIDPIVPVIESRRMVSAIRKAGGSPMYTEYKFMLHNIWNLAYADPAMLLWLFQQRRLTHATPLSI
jgi:predicted peptidase